MTHPHSVAVPQALMADALKWLQANLGYQGKHWIRLSVSEFGFREEAIMNMFIKAMENATGR